jgi:hypothetical protein
LADTKPFDQLSDDDKKAATDVVVATLLIGLRIPSTGTPLYQYLANEFAKGRSLPANMVRYALQGMGQALVEEDWTLTVYKVGERLTSKFTPTQHDGNGQGATPEVSP